MKQKSFEMIRNYELRSRSLCIYIFGVVVVFFVRSL